MSHRAKENHKLRAKRKARENRVKRNDSHKLGGRSQIDWKWFLGK